MNPKLVDIPPNVLLAPLWLFECFAWNVHRL